MVQRLKHLDVIRGLSALTVVFSHFVERTPLHQSWLLSHFNLGQFGVIIFFIISGMVIPYSLDSKQGEVKSFVISRLFRLYPAYWFSVFMAVLSSIFFNKLLPGTKVILFNLTMFHSVFRVPDLFGVYWTLILELMFYIACILLFSLGLLKNKKSNFIIAVSFLIVAFILSCVRWFLAKKIPVFIPLSMSLMFFGSLWKEASVDNDQLSRRYCVWWGIMFYPLTTLRLFISLCYIIPIYLLKRGYFLYYRFKNKAGFKVIRFFRYSKLFDVFTSPICT